MTAVVRPPASISSVLLVSMRLEIDEAEAICIAVKRPGRTVNPGAIRVDSPVTITCDDVPDVGACSRDARAASTAAEAPAAPITAHDARHCLTDMSVPNRPPGHQCALARFLHEGEASAHRFDRPAVDAVDAIARLRLREWQSDLLREPSTDAQQVASLERGDHPLGVDRASVRLLGEPLCHQPLAPARLRFSC